jgi:hypothetical protein
MTEPTQLASDEKFQKANPEVLELPGLDMWIWKQHTRLFVCTGDASANLTVDQARQVRDFLNKVLP